MLHFDEIQFINFFSFVDCVFCHQATYLLVLSHVNIFIFKIFNKTSNKLKDINSGTSLAVQRFKLGASIAGDMG